MFLEEINLNFIQPCTTDSKRIRIIATPSRDVSELFSYLNTYLKTAIYNKKGQTLTYNYGPKIIVITKDDIKVSKLLNETDAFETLDYIKDFINDCYDKKDSIITKMNLGEKGDFESKSAIKNVIIQIDD